MLYEWISTTRTMGLIAYTAALAACLIRWAKVRGDGERRLIYSVLAAVQLALALDKIFDWRWRLHEHWMRMAMAEGVYDRRRPYQLVILGALALALLAGVVWMMRRFRSRLALMMAMMSTLLSIGLWGCEAISYHYFDRVLFYKVGHAMVVGFLWAGLALLTTIAAWRDALSSKVG